MKLTVTPSREELMLRSLPIRYLICLAFRNPSYCLTLICAILVLLPVSVEAVVAQENRSIANSKIDAPKSVSLNDLPTSIESRLIQSAKGALAATVAIEYSGEQGSGSASGVLVSADGLVMTAGHCVERPGSKVEIVLSDGRKFSATGFGLEITYDCGLFKIDSKALAGEKLPFAEMGWSSELEPNQPIFSLGHGGKYNKVRGAYLRFGKVVDGCCKPSGMIKSTCLMEPGDSGGPLFNLDGQVVGIHSSINQRLDQNYDVPVDLFRHYWPLLNKPEEFRWNRVESESAFGLRVSRNRAARGRLGVRVMKLEESSWATRQGFQRSDQIQTWDGKKVSGSMQLNVLMIGSLFSKAKTARVEVKRDDEVMEMTVDFNELAALNKNPIANYPANKAATKVASVDELEDKLKAIEAQLDDHSVKFKGSQTIGTIVQLKGRSKTWLITKSSLISADSQNIVFENGQEAVAKVVARDEEKDLALLDFDEQDAHEALAIVLGDEQKMYTTPGRLLIAPSPTDEGEISALSSREFDSRARGFVGVMPESSDTEFVVQDVTKGSPAENAGIEAGDQFLALDGEDVLNYFEVMDFLDGTSAQQTILVKLKRGDKELKKKLTLGEVPADSAESDQQQWHVASSFAGGKSKIRGFAEILLHDSRVKAAQCGGPVFDASRKFVGINIARASRTQSYILPARLVADLIKKAGEK